MITTIIVTFLGLQSAQAFFNKMFDSILRAPMSFFDTTPSGRILSRVCVVYPTKHRIYFFVLYAHNYSLKSNVNLLPITGIIGPIENWYFPCVRCWFCHINVYFSGYQYCCYLPSCMAVSHSSASSTAFEHLVPGMIVQIRKCIQDDCNHCSNYSTSIQHSVMKLR